MTGFMATPPRQQGRITNPNRTNAGANQAGQIVPGQAGQAFDLQSLTNPRSGADYDEAIHNLDFQILEQTPDQVKCALTIRSFRGGLNMQRGPLEKAHSRMLSSTLISDNDDQLVLPFAVGNS